MTSLSSLLGGSATSAVIIVLDNSASMALDDEGRPRFEAATRAAEKILDELREGDSVALVLTGGPVLPEQGKLFHTHETVREMLGKSRVSYERADLAAKLQQARRLLSESDAPNKEIYVITDNQAISWDGLKSETDVWLGSSLCHPTPSFAVNTDREFCR